MPDRGAQRPAPTPEEIEELKAEVRERHPDWEANVNQAGEMRFLPDDYPAERLALIKGIIVADDGLRQVLLEVKDERELQVQNHGWSHEHDDQHTPADWGWLLARRTVEISCPFPTAVVDVRRQLIEVAAIAIAAVESYDRKEQRIRDAEVAVRRAEGELHEARRAAANPIEPGH